jgi:FkbM family methyltransferase
MGNLTRHDVEMAYRLILGREPEGPEAISYHMRCSSISELRLALLDSEEFKQSQKRTMAPAVVSFDPRDVLLKHIDLPRQRSIMLALPAMSNDPIVSQYLSGLTSNSYMLDVMLKLTNQNDQVIDLGAHLGTFSVPAAALGRRVLSVDAVRMHIDMLQISKSVNGLEDLSLTWGAVAKENGQVSFVDVGLFGHVDFDGTDKASILTPAKTLKTIIEEHEFDAVTFIKADIEGSELHALESISSLLESADGPGILYESNAETFANAGYSVVEMRHWLEKMSYKSFRMEEDRWIYVSPEQPQPELWVDILALKERHQRDFRGIIDFHWAKELMIRKLVKWGQLPHANARRHVASVLSDERSLLEAPELSKLLEQLMREF